MITFIEIMYKDEVGEWREKYVSLDAIVEFDVNEHSISLVNGHSYVISGTTIDLLRKYFEFKSCHY